MEAVAVLFSIPRAAWGGLDPNVGQKDTVCRQQIGRRKLRSLLIWIFATLSVAKLNTPRPLACD